MKIRTLHLILSILILTISVNSFTQDAEDDHLLEFYGKPKLVDQVLKNDDYRFQYILTQVKKDSINTNYLTKGHLTDDYFYPASTVKLPVALLVLEQLNKYDVDLSSLLEIHPDVYCGNMSYVNRLKKDKPDFKTIIRELITISDNQYYNVLYHFLGPELIRDSLESKGYTDTKIYRCFSGCELPESMYTNSWTITDTLTGKTVNGDVKHLDLAEFANAFDYDSSLLLGRKHEYRRENVPGPFDFNYNLRLPLAELHRMMLVLMHPEYFEPHERWKIREEDRQLLLQALKERPVDLNNPAYKNRKDYPDNIFKYLIVGDDDQLMKHYTSYSKIGISYGFVTETAYIDDPISDSQFLLTVSVYVNENDIVNDGRYEYEDIARPFMAEFGRIILNSK